MIARRIELAVGLVVSACVFGCPPAGQNGAAGQSLVKPQWINLMDESRIKRWRVIKGTASFDDGVIVLNSGSSADASIMADGVDLKDGAVEIEMHRRHASRDDAPITVALRLVPRIDFSSVYIVCRPEQVEACRSAIFNSQPGAEFIAKIPKAERPPEVWRFVMTGGRIDCFRFGQKVLTYADPNPRHGTIALTASNCRVLVSAVRYMPSGN
jgi:hypothetical protein